MDVLLTDGQIVTMAAGAGPARSMLVRDDRIAEVGPAEPIFAAPRHPYTAALLASMPSLDPDARTQEAPISGDPPNPINPPPGCRFHTRCRFAEPPCSAVEPAATAVGEKHIVACHMAVAGSGHKRAVAA